MFYIETNLSDAQILNIARLRIFCFKKEATEKLLNNIIQEKYNISLENACLLLLFKAKLLKSDDGVYISWKSKIDQQLAQLITYGNGIIQGSKILQAAFS